MEKKRKVYRITFHPIDRDDIKVEFSDPLEGLRKLVVKDVMSLWNFGSFNHGTLPYCGTIKTLEYQTWLFIINTARHCGMLWDFSVLWVKGYGFVKEVKKEKKYSSDVLIGWAERKYAK